MCSHAGEALCILLSFIYYLQNIHNQFERVKMDEDFSNSNRGCSSFNSDLQTLEFSFNKTTKEYCCNICSFKSKLKSNSAIHLRKHSKERPYKCEVCNSSFRYLTSLKNHKLIHTGERPYRCEVCNKSFIQKISLIKHIHANIHAKILSRL